MQTTKKHLPEYLFELFFNRFGRNRKSHDLILFFLREHPSISVADEVTRELQATVNKWIEGEDRPVNKLQ